MATEPTRDADLVRCQACHEPTFDLVCEVCRSCGAVPLAPLRDDDDWCPKCGGENGAHHADY